MVMVTVVLYYSIIVLYDISGVIVLHNIICVFVCCFTVLRRRGGSLERLLDSVPQHSRESSTDTTSTTPALSWHYWQQDTQYPGNKYEAAINGNLQYAVSPMKSGNSSAGLVTNGSGGSSNPATVGVRSPHNQHQYTEHYWTRDELTKGRKGRDPAPLPDQSPSAADHRY